MPWRTTDGKVIAAKGQPELNILIEGIFDRRRLLDSVCLGGGGGGGGGKTDDQLFRHVFDVPRSDPANAHPGR